VDLSLRRALAGALGEDAVTLDGAVIAPSGAEGVAEVLRLAQEHGIRLRITSGQAAGVEVPAGVSVLSLSRLAAITVDPRNGVARAEAGVTLDVLRASLADAGVTVAALPASPSSEHVGSLIARGEVPRRSLTGIEAVLPGGDTIRLGGSVLKDVVGYDVASLLLGSWGRLAAIVAVHLRLVPAGIRPPAAEPGGQRAGDGVSAVFDPQGILVGA